MPRERSARSASPLVLCWPLLAGVCAFTWIPEAHAQSTEWERTLLIYLLGAGIDGESQVGSTVANIDQSFGDIIENLEAGGMGAFRARKGPWAHTIDAMYSGLGAEASTSGVSVDVDVDQLIASYDIGYEIAENLQVLAGVRYNAIDVDLAVRAGTASFRASGDKDWVDPYVGLSSTLVLTDTLALSVRGDIGGFDVGSKFAWQAVVLLDWRFSETFLAAFGYRILDTDYEDGSGASFFRYDVTMSGPAIGIGWRFR
jgi:hypothetical protein